MSTSAATQPIGRIRPAPTFPQEGTQIQEPLAIPMSARAGIVATGGCLDAGHEAVIGLSSIIEMDDPWSWKGDLVQAKNITQRTIKSFQFGRLEWPLKHARFEFTDFDLAPAFNKLDEETAQFVVDHDLATGVAWLQTVTPRFFGGADFEIDLLPAEDGEGNLLALKVYGAFNSSEFRKRRHRICEEMLAAKHRGLYEVISIFQRRVTSSGWQAFSWYSSLSAE